MTPLTSYDVRGILLDHKHKTSLEDDALVRYQMSDECPGCRSLRNNMFELADRLIGIYKTDNCTKSITINPKSFAVPAPEV